MRQPPKPLNEAETTLTTGLVATIIGIVLYCIGQAFGADGSAVILAPETGAGIMATGILILLKGAVTLSLEL